LRPLQSCTKKFLSIYLSIYIYIYNMYIHRYCIDICDPHISCRVIQISHRGYVKEIQQNSQKDLTKHAQYKRDELFK